MSLVFLYFPSLLSSSSLRRISDLSSYKPLTGKGKLLLALEKRLFGLELLLLSWRSFGGYLLQSVNHVGWLN